MKYQNFLQIALQYFQAGFRVIPINEHKVPTLPPNTGGWKRYEQEQTEADINFLFAQPCFGIAVLTGINFLECLDIDLKYDLTGNLESEYLAALEGYEELRGLNLTKIRTTSGGKHWIYRCPEIEGNKSIAKREATAQELMKFNEEVRVHNEELLKAQSAGQRTNERQRKQIEEPSRKPKVLIETRGVGGYIVAYPTPGYQIEAGAMATIPTISVEQRKILHRVAQTFNQIVKNKERIIPKPVHFQVPNEQDLNPWDDYDKSADTVALLESYGWKRSHLRGKRQHMQRPGKTCGVSGNFSYGLNLFYCFSSSTEFEENKAYSPSAVYAYLEHGGDFSKAGKALYEMGYGARKDPRQQVQLNGRELNGSTYSLPKTEEEIQEEADDLWVRVTKSRFDISKKPKNIDFCLTAHIENENYNIAGFGMLGLVTGLAKTRKSTFLKALMASVIASGDPRLQFRFDLKGKKALFIDTEQPEYFFHRNQSQSHYLAGTTENVPIYEAYGWRDFSVEERVSAVDLLIERNDDLGLIVLDGALDLCKNFNSEEEAQKTVQQMMTWTKTSGAMIITVIHKNRHNGFAMGHLGSMLEKKVDFGIQMTNLDDGFTEVKQILARSRPFKEFTFTQDADGYPILNHNNPAAHCDPSVKRELNGSTFQPSYEVLAPQKEPDLIITGGNGLNDDEDIPF